MRFSTPVPSSCLALSAAPFLSSQAQVSSQIKVRDLSRATVTASPAQFSSWNEARSELCACRRVQPRAPRRRSGSRASLAAQDD